MCSRAGGCAEDGKFRFGTAFSSADTLSLAVLHAMRQAVEQLDGAPPHLCQVSNPTCPQLRLSSLRVSSCRT